MKQRELAVSHKEIRSLSGYLDFFRQNSGVVQAIIERKKKSTNNWEEIYVIFEDEVLTFYDLAQDSMSPTEIIDSIPMESVATVRTDRRAGDRTITINTIDPAEEIFFTFEIKRGYAATALRVSESGCPSDITNVEGGCFFAPRGVEQSRQRLVQLSSTSLPVQHGNSQGGSNCEAQVT